MSEPAPNAFTMNDDHCGQLFNLVTYLLARRGAQIYFSGRLAIAQACYKLIIDAADAQGGKDECVPPPIRFPVPL